MISFRSIATFLCFCFLLSLGCSAQKTGPEYIAEIEQHRTEKNEKFKKNKEETPLEKKERKKFSALNYFPVDEAFRLSGTFKRTPNETPFKMKTSTDRLVDYVQYGTISFDVQDRHFTIPAYQNIALSKEEKYKDHLIILFTDQTTGEGTYGGGRYLDFKIPESNEVTLDFNLAYNPYCSYSDRYSCPIPPDGTFIKAAINAGEKNYKDAH